MSQQINLFNPVFLKKKKYFSAVTMAQALGLILAGSLVLSVYVNLQLSGLAREADATGAQLKTAQEQLTRLTVLAAQRSKSKALEDEAQKAEAEAASFQQQFEVLDRGGIGNTKGYSEYLRAFSRQIVDGLWLTGLTLNAGGNDIGIRGRALRPDLVPVYINRLKREPVMQGKAFATLEMQTPVERAPATASAGNVAPMPREPLGYIEFRLRSSDVEAEKVQSGANTK